MSGINGVAGVGIDKVIGRFRYHTKGDTEVENGRHRPCLAHEEIKVRLAVQLMDTVEGESEKNQLVIVTLSPLEGGYKIGGFRRMRTKLFVSCLVEMEAAGGLGRQLALDDRTGITAVTQ